MFKEDPDIAATVTEKSETTIMERADDGDSTTEDSTATTDEEDATTTSRIDSVRELFSPESKESMAALEVEDGDDLDVALVVVELLLVVVVVVGLRVVVVVFGAAFSVTRMGFLGVAAVVDAAAAATFTGVSLDGALVGARVVTSIGLRLPPASTGPRPLFRSHGGSRSRSSSLLLFSGTHA